MSERSPEWLTSTNPTTFFFEKVTSAQQKQGTKLTENVEFYLVHLLQIILFYKKVCFMAKELLLMSSRNF